LNTIASGIESKICDKMEKSHIFIDKNGNEKKLWQIGLGKKYFAHKLIHDLHTGQKMQCDLWWTEVRHVSYAYQLYLLKVRIRNKVFYLITNEQVKTEDQVWILFLPIRDDGKLKQVFAMENAS